MMTCIPDTVTLVPINRIQILNSCGCNLKVFEEIVDSICAIGLHGELHIPALVMNVADKDAFIISLAENTARWKS